MGLAGIGRASRDLRAAERMASPEGLRVGGCGAKRRRYLAARLAGRGCRRGES
jgi:hypothetical protein